MEGADLEMSYKHKKEDERRFKKEDLYRFKEEGRSYYYLVRYYNFDVHFITNYVKRYYRELDPYFKNPTAPKLPKNPEVKKAPVEPPKDFVLPEPEVLKRDAHKKPRVKKYKKKDPFKEPNEFITQGKNELQAMVKEGKFEVIKIPGKTPKGYNCSMVKFNKEICEELIEAKVMLSDICAVTDTHHSLIERDLTQQGLGEYLSKIVNIYKDFSIHSKSYPERRKKCREILERHYKEFRAVLDVSGSIDSGVEIL